MELTWHPASIEDLELLADTRVEVLRAANELDDSADLREVRAQSYDYYKEALANGSHAAYLVFDGDRFVGAGGVSFFRVMPTCHNLTGRKAYIMNLYTHPDYRRQGIAYRTLALLVLAAKAKGIIAISLEATDMGRPLYEKFGFVPLPHEMELAE